MTDIMPTVVLSMGLAIVLLPAILFVVWWICDELSS